MHSDEVVHASSFFLRLGLGSTLFYLGAMKVFSATAQIVWLDWLKSVPLVQPLLAIIWFNLIMYIELIGGLALLGGVFTRYAAGTISVLLLTNLFLLNWYLPPELLGPWGPFVIKDLALLGAAITLMITGAPFWSIDELFRESWE